jgi:hypothetical protein
VPTLKHCAALSVLDWQYELRYSPAVTQESDQVPRWLSNLGKFAAVGIALLALDLVYEQTLLTWKEGNQMVGFSLTHILGPLLLLPILAGAIFILGMLLLVFLRWLRHRPWPKVNWVPVFVVTLGPCIAFIPYGFWKRATIGVMGPGPNAAQFLVYAAHDGDRPTVDLLLNHGVPVDISNRGSTALNGACAGGQLEMAHFLLSKGADVSRAPDCEGFLK